MACLLLTLSLGCATTALSQIGATAESITIHPGKVNAFTYHHCRLLKVEHDGAHIAYDHGTAKIPYASMPAEWQAALRGGQSQGASPQPQASSSQTAQPAVGENPGELETPTPATPTLLFVTPVGPGWLSELKIEQPAEFRNAVKLVDGVAQVPVPVFDTPPEREFASGWIGTRRFGPMAPDQVALLIQAERFKIRRAQYLSLLSSNRVNAGQATTEQVAEWSKLANDSRICVGMPADFAHLVVGARALRQKRSDGAEVWVQGNDEKSYIYFRDHKVTGWNRINERSPNANAPPPPLNAPPGLPTQAPQARGSR
ncbi:hypothetical protein [Prosthecobacter sp.]|uniref:hypothetical protein n=1 Tax=Prosthecobacter sp. TaxID=1965333 RepID=UPI003784BE7A